MNATLSIRDWIACTGIDPDAMSANEERQRATLRGEGGYCPLVAGGKLTQEQDKALPPRANFADEFASHEATLANGLRAAAAHANPGSDATPCIRANMGVGVCATVFGAVQTVFEDKMPWITEHVALESLDDFDAETVPLSPEIVTGLERSAYLAEHLAGSGIAPFCFDTQSPFDLAHLIVGDDIFYAMYDEPERVHRLLDQSARFIIRVTRLYKEAVGEPLDGGRHSGGLTMRGGVRLCEDTSTLLNEEQIETFVVPYANRVLEAFGGGWVHYCGKNDHLFRAVTERMPLAYAINFGNPDMHDMGAAVGGCLACGKTYAGAIPWEKDESADAYFDRVLGYTDGAGRGLILILGGVEGINDLVPLWRQRQGAA